MAIYLISYVIRKAVPLGTEFKAGVDPATGIMSALKIQEEPAMDKLCARMGTLTLPSSCKTVTLILLS